MEQLLENKMEFKSKEHLKLMNKSSRLFISRKYRSANGRKITNSLLIK